MQCDSGGARARSEERALGLTPFSQAPRVATARHECLSAAPTRALRVPAHLRCLVAAHAILDAVEEDRRLRREHYRAELLAQEIRGDALNTG